MKNRIIGLGAIIFICLLSLSGTQVEDNMPWGLMTEFIREPGSVKIHDSKPEFSWIVPDRAIEQTAWQILLASSTEKLQNGKADYWDSGKRIGNRSTELEYRGEDLREGSDYYWKVRVWDKNDQSSLYSEIQHFKTGSFADYVSTSNSFQTSINKAVSIDKLSKGHFLYDFGKDGFGTIILHIETEKEANLIVHLGEKLNAKNTIDRDPGGSVRYRKTRLVVSPDQTDYILHLPANERNTGGKAILLPDSMGVILPFRYAEIEKSPVELSTESVFQRVYSYYFDDQTSYFNSSDTLLNQIWEICKYSMKATSFTGLYIDGDRERIPYEGDAYINQLGHYCADREYSMARRTNEYFIHNPTWPTEWILHTVPMFYTDYLYTGNSESIQVYYDNLKLKTLHFLARQDGLISVYSDKLTPEYMHKIGFNNPDEKLRDLVDWPPGQQDTGWDLAKPAGERDGYDMLEINTVVNSFYYWNLNLMSEIAGVLKEKEDSIYFQELAQKVKLTINEVLFNPQKGVYVDGEGSNHSSLHANMLPLAVGLVPDEYEHSVIEFIKSRGMACSVYGAQHLLEGLYNAGEEAYAYDLLTATHDRSWWNMIKTGSTITMEAWDMKYKPNADWNHAWGAVPANIIPRQLWGIQPSKPGFAEAVIQPQLGPLTFSEIKFPTIRGPIEAKYELTSKNTRLYSVKIPANMQVRFVLPLEKTEYNEIFLNGNLLSPKQNSIPLEHGWNTVEF